MAKILLSFLGTRNYLECNYYLNEKKVEGVKYIQEALVRFLCEEWTEEDKIVIFITEESREKHWNTEDDVLKKDHSPKLKEILESLNLDCEIKTVLIPVGRSEEELWEIFEKMFDSISKEDEIILDITHAFRFIPFLMLIVLNYSIVIKKISILGIYYGAFEAIGAYNEVKEMPVEKRNAPVFDLSPFIDLLNWTLITQNFLKFGELRDVNRFLKRRREKHNTFFMELKKEQNLFNQINAFTSLFKTNRGYEIIKEHDFKALKTRIKRVERKDSQTRLLNHLLELIYLKLKNFENEDIENGYRAVDWCIEHGLVQQAYTLLQENMISEIFLKVYTEEKLRDHDLREKIVKNAFNDKIKYNYEEFYKEKKEYLSDEELNEIVRINKIIPEEYILIFQDLRNYRNDINHAGLTKDPKKSRVLIKSIKELNERIKKVREKEFKKQI
ncbi:MAG: TIGR02221 family CRISPR-associated protein [Candidatus Heimdallarchaeum endolithica]|uniref:TIGR02221 family CRISPR-associated protein n=1 Tax=Candidatus Heimdallarchaeum endolithica TaxID=2876572 RepID=A0A9Y1BSN7_9ARCH|nr:MAG: TIGR02221 family CRISPR-associated protein [Candidatus Heimdallarchaeum endolithica]